MIGLRDLAVASARSWEDAEARFQLPTLERYNIAADCLRAPADAPAILEARGDRIVTVTFGELDARSARLAWAFASLGLKPGDRVAVKLSQSAEMAVVMLAVLRLGAVAMPVPTVLGEEAVRHRLEDGDPQLIVALGSDLDRGLADEAHVSLITTGDEAPAPHLQALIAGASSAPFPFAPTEPDDPALLLYTSGTTGNSKGVLHGHRVVLGHHAVNWALDVVRPGDVAYSPVDWAWAGGLFLGLLVPLAYGIPVVAFRERHFDPERVLRLLRECGVSVGLFPPTVLRMLHRSELITPAVAANLRLRALVTGAEAVEPELLRWADAELQVTVNNAYGQTEANALVGHSSVLGRLDPSVLGRPYPGRRIAVLDEARHPAAPGALGEIAVGADDPVCMLRYWRNPKATAARLIDGWLMTGDSARVDKRGQLRFHGRTDDLIKSGGYRIGPTEVEAALLLDGAVGGCAVVGLPDPIRGQAVTAFIQLRGDAADTDREQLSERLRQLVRARVGAHAYPRAIEYLTELPHTAMGKVNRVALRERFANGLPPGTMR